jgi:ABC-type multidrug transport system fused ATPase/permease subunit
MLLGYPSVRLIHFFEEAKKAFEQKQGGRPIGALTGDIRFRRVGFSYPGHPVFGNLSFDIPKGKITAITGRSGVGKTTLINLLLGFFEHYEGEVFINGEELREIDLFSLRRRVGLVGQEPLLFQGSIRENICLGKPDASLGEIVEAATIANAHLFIERFKAGYETDVAEGGLSLSVGEKQRIAIARAVILKPDLLIFDEPTSALDAESERLIAESIRRISRESTVILISHKPSTLVAADRVLKMEGGTIFEEARDRESSAPIGVALTSSVHP